MATLVSLRIAQTADFIVAGTIINQILHHSNEDRAALGIPTRDDIVQEHQLRLEEALDEASAEAREQANDTLAQYRAGQACLPPSIAKPLRDIALVLRPLPRPSAGGEAPSSIDIARLLRATDGSTAAPE